MTACTEYHPYVLTHLDPVLNIMAEHSIRVASYGPMSPVLRHPNKTGGPIRPLLTKVAERLSREHGGIEVDDAMVCLLWCRAKGAIAVSASANPRNIEKMASTQRLPDLTTQEVDEIEQLGRKVHFRAYVSERVSLLRLWDRLWRLHPELTFCARAAHKQDEHMCVDFPAPDLPQDL